MSSEVLHSDDAFEFLERQTHEIRQNLAREGIELEIDPGMPAAEQLTLLQHAARDESARCRQRLDALRQVTERIQSLHPTPESPSRQHAGCPQAEETLEQHEKDLRHAQAVAQTGSWRLDLRSSDIHWSDETYRIFGIPNGTPMTYQTFFAAIYPNDRAYVETQWAAALQGAPYDIEHRILVGDTVKWVRERAVLEFNEHGAILGGFGAVQDITAHKQAEEALQASEARYRALVETSPNAITQSDLHGRILACNAQTVRMHGYAQVDEIIGLSAFELIAPEDRELAAANMLSVLENGIVSNLQYTLLRKDGSRFPGELSVAAIRDADGHPSSFVAITRDVSEQKRAEEALKASEARYRQLYQAITDALLIHEVFPDGSFGNFIEVNDVAAERLGYTREELLRLSPADIDASDPSINIQPLIAKMLAGEDRIFEQVHCAKDGRRIPVEIHAHPFTWQGRRVVMSLVRDITQRKQIEEALARERAFLNAAIEILPLPLFFMDRDKRLIRVNAAMRQQLGEAGVTDIFAILPLDPITHTPIAEERRPTSRALRGEVVTAEEYLLSVPEIGLLSPCLEYAAPIYIDGDIAAIVFIVQDISALKEEDRAKDEFLATLSHELQTPLTAMLGWSSLAIERDDPDFLRVAMDVVHRNAIRQKALIADMLDISRLIHRKLGIVPVLIDLGDQTRQAVENIQHQAAEIQLVVSLHLTDTPLPILADPERIQQCLGNLLHNSLKFTPPGGQITVVCRRDGDMAVLVVQDTGRGIASEMLPFIFNPFHQVDRNERTGGLGLGLAVTRGLVELHDGHIRADSTGEGHGCTITMVLPLAKATAGGAGSTG